MRYRTLGDTDLEVSEIGFGCWGIGGASQGSVAYGPTDDAESRKALERALDLGVTFFDTAPLYGEGHSERLLGEVLADQRSRVVLATKVGLLDHGRRQDFSAAHVRTSLDESLRRLRTDYVDLLQLHGPDPALLGRDDSVLSVLDALKREGRIREAGISVRSPDDGLVAIRSLGFRVLQVNFSIVDQRAAENGLLALAEQRGVGIVVRTPLCFGFLTGAYSDTVDFHPNDHRRRWSEKQRRTWSTALDTFGLGAATRDSTPAQLALRFCLSHPQVSTAIPGMLDCAQVEENTAASRLGPLEAPVLERFHRIHAQSEFFVDARGGAA